MVAALSDARIRALLAHSTEAMSLCDGEGVILYISPCIERIVGWSPAQLIGTDLVRWLHEDDRATVSELLRAMAADPERRGTLELRLPRADGSPCWIEVSYENRLHDPKVAAVVASMRDLTAPRAAHSALEQSELKFRALADLSPAPILVHADLQIRYANAAAARLIGL